MQNVYRDAEMHTIQYRITYWETLSDHTVTTAYWLINVDHGQIFILQTFIIVNSRLIYHSIVDSSTTV